jgi:hypothetical protein
MVVVLDIAVVSIAVQLSVVSKIEKPREIYCGMLESRFGS